jgi:aminocarboxymuconate-semialdehyde decarboxylase
VAIIDVHSHIFTDALIAALADSGMRSELAYALEPDGQVMLTFDGKPRLGPIPQGIREVDARLRDMDRQGVDMQILATAPMMFSYDEPPAVGLEIARRSNDCFIGIARQHPRRFNVFAQLPLQDVELSRVELRRVAAEPLVRGVQVGSHVDGTNLDDPAFEPLWADLERSSLPVLVHPYHPAGANRMRSHYLHNLVGNPLDSTIAIASLIFGGVTDRFPGLRFCFVHGGGFAPYQIGRWDHGWAHRAESRGIDRPPSEYLQGMYFDTLTHDPLSLRFLGQRAGWDHVVLGSDYPFDMATPDPVRAVEEVVLDPDSLRAVLEGNAEALLRGTGVAGEAGQ